MNLVDLDILDSKMVEQDNPFVTINMNGEETVMIPLEYLYSLPSVSENPNEWIPVTKKLPENHDGVLVWFEYIKDDWDCAWWGLAYYSLQNKKWFVDTNERNPIVKAWMPLPKPYEEDKQ